MIYRTDWIQEPQDLAKTLEDRYEHLSKVYSGTQVRLVTVQLLPRNPGEGQAHRAVWEIEA